MVVGFEFYLREIRKIFAKTQIKKIADTTCTPFLVVDCTVMLFAVFTKYPPLPAVVRMNKHQLNHEWCDR